jgi:hypothetical protein
MRKVFISLVICLFALAPFSPSGVRAASDLNINNGANYLLDATYGSFPENSNPPEVALSFYPQQPSKGEVVTATASPSGLGDSSNLYFTWFLKRENCPDNKSKCDLNNDNHVDIEDYKIEAMRILAKGDFNSEEADYDKDKDDDGYKARLGGDNMSDLSKCYIHDFDSGLDFKLKDCDHLFPDENLSGEDVGDNSFGTKEEKFWRTNPDNNNTNGNGISDEANVVGLGASSFSWTYESGDKIGVVVEGTLNGAEKVSWAMPENNCSLDDFLKIDIASSNEIGSDTTTKKGTLYGLPFISETTVSKTTATGDYDGHANSTFTTIRETEEATSIDPDNLTAFTSTTVYETITVSYVGWLTITTTQVIQPRVAISYTSEKKEDDDVFAMNVEDVNNCLEDNLVSPESTAEGSYEEEKEKTPDLDISLTATPNNAYNSPAGENPLKLSVASTVYGNVNADSLSYTWKVYGSQDAVSWKEILKKDLDALDATPLSGLGLKNFSFALAFNEKPIPKYLKIKVVATENNDPNPEASGTSEIIVPIPSLNTNLKTFSTAATNNESSPLSLEDERCASDSGEKCYAAPNEILGFKISSNDLMDFFWSVDGKPFAYPVCPLADCASEQNKTAFLPILKNAGETYSVTLQATDKKTGEKIKLSQTIQVVTPFALLTSADKTTCAPILLGYFKDLDDNLTPDYSLTSFATTPGATIKLKPTLNVPLLGTATWTIDETTFTKDTAEKYSFEIKDDGTLIFPTDKKVGDLISVKYSALYTQPNSLKKVLHKYWEVPLNNFYEKRINATIEIKVVAALANKETGVNLQTNLRQKFLATVISNLPYQLVFLIKIILAGLLLLFGSHFFLTFFSKQNHV